MPPLYDNIANAYELIADGEWHTVDFDNTGATYETNESTYGEGEEGVWAKLDLTKHDATRDIFCYFKLELVSGTVVPYLDLVTIDNSSSKYDFDPSSPDFSKLDFVGKSVYGDGASAQFKLGISGSDIPNTSYRGSGIFYFFIGDGDFVGGTGIQRLTYRVPKNQWTFEEVGTKHRGVTNTQGFNRCPSPVLTKMGANLYQTFAHLSDTTFVVQGPFVYKFDGTSWTVVGSGPLEITSGDYCGSVSICNDGSSLYVAWVEANSDLTFASSNSSAAGIWHCKKWNGSTWTELGTGQKKTTRGLISDISICIYNGSPTVAWNETDLTNTNTYVQQWNGSTWGDLGTNPINSTDSRGLNNGYNGGKFVDTIIDSASDLSVVWVDKDPPLLSSPFHNYVHIRKYSGGSWGTEFSQESGVSPIFNGDTSRTINGAKSFIKDDIIYICASDNGFGASSANSAIIFQFDGSLFSSFPTDFNRDEASRDIGIAFPGYMGDFCIHPTKPKNYFMCFQPLSEGKISFPVNNFPILISYWDKTVWKILRIETSFDSGSGMTFLVDDTDVYVSFFSQDLVSPFDSWVRVIKLVPVEVGGEPGELTTVLGYHKDAEWHLAGSEDTRDLGYHKDATWQRKATETNRNLLAFKNNLWNN